MANTGRRRPAQVALIIATLAAALFAPLAARAQSSPAGTTTTTGPIAPAASPAGGSVPADASATDVAAPSPSDAAARADYDDAFAAMVDGDFARAEVGFQGVAARAQDPALVASARELARLAHELVARKATFAKPGGPGTIPAGPIDDRDEGRTSFVVWTTMFGVYAGVVAIDDFNVEDFRIGILTVTGTTAAGLFGSLGATRHRLMTGSMADAYSLGMVEGFANAGLLVTPAGLGSSEHVQTTRLLSGGVGGAAGLLYGYELRPTRGQISFASTLSLLGFASTGLGFGIIQPTNLDGNTALITIAAGTDVGLGAGLVLGRDLDWSVSRGRIVQLGALLGGLSGLAVGALITGASASTDDDTRILSGATLAGMWGGFALAVSSTRGMRPDHSPPEASAYRTPDPHASTTIPPRNERSFRSQLVAMPLRGGGGLALVGSF